MGDVPPVKLLTFAPMIDSEACRLILAHHAVPYWDDSHLLGWTSILAIRHGLTVRIPLLYGDRLRVAGAYEIAQYFDARAPLERRLLPNDKPLADSVATAWTRFNFTFGLAVAVFAYFHLLPHRALMLEPLSRGLPPCERRFLDRRYGTFTGFLRLILWLTAAHAQSALATIRATFDDMDRELMDGRLYLFGDRLTLADIALASSAGPVLLPDGFGSPLPALEQMPSEMSSLITELRQHETARFVRSIYRAHGAQAELAH